MLAFNAFLFHLMVSLRAPMYRGLSFLLAFVLAFSGLTSPLPVKAERTSSPVQPEPAKPAPVGMLFVPNAGQTDSSVRFETQAFGGSVYFTENEVVLALPGSEISPAAAPSNSDVKPATVRKAGPVARLHFEGASKATIRAEEQQSGAVNILLGSDRQKWVTGLHTFGALVYTSLYPGVDLRYEGTEGSLKGTYQVAPGADPSKIRWSYQGSKNVSIDSLTGDLQISLSDGRLTEQAPLAWQDINGQRVPVSARYELRQGNSVGFSLGNYDKTKPLTIDPTLVYSSYLGGGGADRINAVSVDPATHNIFVAGETSSVPFPGSTGPAPSIYPNMFVVQLRPDGSSVYRTIIGGGNSETANAIIARSGVAVVAGNTYSDNFPTVTNGTWGAYQGGSDMAVLKLDATGLPTFVGLLGSDSNDTAYGVALLNSTIYVTGSTDGILTYTGCPAGFCTPHGGTDVLAASFDTTNPTPVLGYALQLGGYFSDVGRAIAVDSGGKAYMTGYTSSNGISGTTVFPTVSPYQAATGGGQDAFILMLGTDGSQQYGSFLGGSSLDEGRGIAVDPAGGTVYLTGRTLSKNFPTLGLANGQDAFVMKLNLATNTVGYSKLLGGSGTETGSAIVLDASGFAYVSGSTSTDAKDVTNPFVRAFAQNDSNIGGNNDAFMTRLDSSGVITYSTRFGGSSDDFATGLGVDASGAVMKIYVGGYTNSTNFPVVIGQTESGQNTAGGGDDGFLVQLANSLPVVDLNDNDATNGIDYAVTFTEGSGPVLLSSGSLAVSDNDSPLLPWAKVAFVSRSDGINESLGVTLDATITSAYDAAAGVLTLTGSPTTTLANWAAVLGSVTYNNASTAPTPGARTISFEINDGLNSNAPLAIATVTVVETNDAPVVTLTGSPTVDEDTLGPISGISVADPDARSGALDLTLTVPATDGTLTAANGGGSATVTGSDTNTVGIHGSLADITTALTTLQFQGVLDFNGTTTLTATLNDNGNTGTPATPKSDSKSFTITVAAVNDAPVVPTSPITVDATENTPKVLVLNSDLGLSDSKDTTTPPAASGATAFIGVSSITITANPSSGLITKDIGTGTSPATITYTPNAGFNGTDTFTYQVCDSGTGTGSGCATQIVNVNVTGVNDPPSFNLDPTYAVITVLEDQNPNSYPGLALNLSAGPSDESGQVLDFMVSNDNNALFATQPNLTVNGTKGDLTFTLAPDANGSATVTVRLHDNGGGTNTSGAQTFMITVTPVNDVPSFTKGADVTVNEDSGAQTATGWAYYIQKGPADEAGQLVDFIVSNDNNTLFSVQPAIAADGTLTFTPADNAHGTATVSVKIHDNGGNDALKGDVDTSAVQTFTITVNDVNDQPSFQGGADVSGLVEDSGAHSVAGWATNMVKGPVDESGQTLSFVFSSSRNGMFSAGPAIDPATGDLTFTLAPNANGEVTVTVWMKDSGGTAFGGVDTSAPTTFKITVGAVNDAPLVPVAPVTVNVTENTDRVIYLTADLGVTDNNDTNPPADSAAATPFMGVGSITITTAPSKGAITGAYLGSASSLATITYRPNTSFVGTDSFTYQVCDLGTGTGLGCSSQTVTLNVAGVNDQPTFTKGTDIPVAPALLLEDNNPNNYPGWATALSAGPADESGQVLDFIVINNNPALFTTAGQPKIAVNGTVGDLSFTLAPDANGEATVTVQLHDNGGLNDTSAPQTFKITVTAVNDQPGFTKGSDVTVLENSPVKTVTLWAINISAGPANEAGQTLTFDVTNDNNGLFIIQPAIAPNGTLTFTPATGQHGSATVSVSLKDNGGTANGGVDTSPVQTFTITVDPINDLSLSITGGGQPVLSGFTTKLTLTATNLNDTDATGAKMTFTLPTDLSFVATGSNPACTAAGQVVTCMVNTIPASGAVSMDIVVKVNAYLSANKDLTFQVTLTGSQPDPVLSNNQVRATVKGAVKLHWYENNFSVTPGLEWSTTQVTKAPLGESFLGEFNNQSITLHFDTVPEHGKLLVTFDLYIIRSWDGNQDIKFAPGSSMMEYYQSGSTIGPDLWEFAAESQTMVHSSFSNWSNLKQSYPDWYPKIENAWLTDAIGRGTLGYTFEGLKRDNTIEVIPDMDSTYRITRILDHSSNTLTLTFRDLGLQGIADESWGLDNITIDLLGTETGSPKYYIPLIMK